MTTFGPGEIATIDPDEIQEGFEIGGFSPVVEDCAGTDCTCGAKDWFAVHCYGCGQTHEAIALDGPTTDCICDPDGAEYR